MTVHNSQRLVELIKRSSINMCNALAREIPQRSHPTHLLWFMAFFLLNLSHIRQQMYDFCHLTKQHSLAHHKTRFSAADFYRSPSKLKTNLLNCSFYFANTTNEYGDVSVVCYLILFYALCIDYFGMLPWRVKN